MIRMHESFHGKSGEIYHYRIYPDLIFIGNEYLLPNDKEIVEANFTVDDVAALFYDSDDFGIVDGGGDGDSLMEKIGELENRKIESGPNPVIAYFNGKFDIVSVNTAIGEILVSRRIGERLDLLAGARIENQITIKLKFPQPVNSDSASQSIIKLLRLFEILIGQPQNLTILSFFKGKEERRAERFEIIQCGLPIHERDDEERHSNVDVLINLIQRQEEFLRIVVNWLDRYKTWEDARLRFFDGFFKQENYDIDRLVSAVNMFDILPDTALPPKTEIPADLKSVITRCRDIILELPSTSSKRHSLLSDLGRVGSNTLRQKIRHRAEILVDVIGNDIPEIFLITDEAVNCRNHYVHGSPLRHIDSSKIGTMLNFFTMTLEFVFAASDLVEAGWNPKTWSRDVRYYHHPFYRYLISYRTSLERLKSSMKSSD